MSKPRTPYNRSRPWVTMGLLAKYYGVNRHTIVARLGKFKEDADLHSLDDLINFIIWHNSQYPTV